MSSPRDEIGERIAGIPPGTTRPYSLSIVTSVDICIGRASFETTMQQEFRPILLCVLLLLLFGCARHEGQDPVSEPIGIRDAWIREPPPHSPAAGYLTIENRRVSPVELVGVETSAAERTEIHVMEHRDGTMRMSRAAGVTIPGHGEVALQPSGTHLMLLDLRRELHAGEDVELVLRFADGTLKRVAVPVRKGGYASN